MERIGKDFGTPATRELCERHAASDGSAVVLGFSGGKESVAAWLYLREFFDRVVPLHACVVPGLAFVEGTLQYYEAFFGSHIYRYVNPAYWRMRREGVFQSREQMRALRGYTFPRYEMNDLVDVVRRLEGVPGAWVATGLTVNDSQSRRGQLLHSRGETPSSRGWHPIWDWDRDRVLGAIEAAGLRLAPEYAWSPRSFNDLWWYRNAGLAAAAARELMVMAGKEGMGL